MAKLIDRVWLWGQTPGSHHATAGYNLPGVNLEGSIDFFADDDTPIFRQGLDVAHDALFCLLRCHAA